MALSPRKPDEEAPGGAGSATAAAPPPAEKYGISPVGTPATSPSLSDKELDDTYQVYKTTADLEATPEEAKKVLRKIDSRVVPILFFTYMLQYLDKNSLNFASVYGLKQGTNLHGQDYSWLGKSS